MAFDFWGSLRNLGNQLTGQNPAWRNVQAQPIKTQNTPRGHPLAKNAYDWEPSVFPWQNSIGGQRDSYQQPGANQGGGMLPGGTGGFLSWLPGTADWYNARGPAPRSREPMKNPNDYLPAAPVSAAPGMQTQNIPHPNQYRPPPLSPPAAAPGPATSNQGKYLRSDDPADQKYFRFRGPQAPLNQQGYTNAVTVDDYGQVSVTLPGGNASIGLSGQQPLNIIPYGQPSNLPQPTKQNPYDTLQLRPGSGPYASQPYLQFGHSSVPVNQLLAGLGAGDQRALLDALTSMFGSDSLQRFGWGSPAGGGSPPPFFRTPGMPPTGQAFGA